MAKEEPSEAVEETKQSKPLLKPKKNEKVSHISSRSSTTNSLANLDSSVPCTWPPFVTNMSS